MIRQFLVAMAATFSFAVLYSVSRKNLFWCSLTGAIGWIIYLSMSQAGMSILLYPFVSAFFLTLLSRVFAVIFKTPVIMYLIPGIFPIVPGAGIYYTAYYFFMNNLAKCANYGLETFKIAMSISFGIIFALAIPQSLIRSLGRLSSRKE